MEERVKKMKSQRKEKYVTDWEKLNIFLFNLYVDFKNFEWLNVLKVYIINLIVQVILLLCLIDSYNLFLYMGVNVMTGFLIGKILRKKSKFILEIIIFGYINFYSYYSCLGKFEIIFDLATYTIFIIFTCFLVRLGVFLGVVSKQKHLYHRKRCIDNNYK